MKNLGKNLFIYHFFHHKFRIDLTGREPGLSRSFSLLISSAELVNGFDESWYL
jgi:hypothetical protein